MASAPPDPDELHKVTVVLSGTRLRGRKPARSTKYYTYMEKIRELVVSYGATVESNEVYVKASVLKARERRAKKSLQRRRG